MEIETRECRGLWECEESREKKRAVIAAAASTAMRAGSWVRVKWSFFSMYLFCILSLISNKINLSRRYKQFCRTMLNIVSLSLYTRWNSVHQKLHRILNHYPLLSDTKVALHFSLSSLSHSPPWPRLPKLDNCHGN